MQDSCKTQFEYEFRHYSREGKLLSVEVGGNLIPDVGRDYIAGAVFGSTTKIQDWYLGIFGASGYTPSRSDTAEFLATNADEITTHDTSRPAFEGDRNGGAWGNAATPVEIVATESTTVRGAFIASTSAFGSTTGTVLSIVKAPSPKVLENGESLTITATIALLT